VSVKVRLAFMGFRALCDEKSKLLYIYSQRAQVLDVFLKIRRFL
jgi:hypothetical protein